MSVNAEEKIKINKTQLESILRLGFTQRQVCDFFGTSKSSLLRFVKENYNGRTFEQLKAEYTAQTQSMIMLNLLKPFQEERECRNLPREERLRSQRELLRTSKRRCGERFCRCSQKGV